MLGDWVRHHLYLPTDNDDDDDDDDDGMEVENDDDDDDDDDDDGGKERRYLPEVDMEELQATVFQLASAVETKER